MLWPAFFGLRVVFGMYCTQKSNLFVSTLEWCHLIVKAVAKCVIFKSNESKRKSCKMS